ncbi:MAG: type II toxin-antitoxin system Phd/YefM family antitoxin [Chloroflexi bacterium]|nr:type II toxin-antitoxin system Phd/YefM family antitoxin [Chloroflexota bacterium]
MAVKIVTVSDLKANLASILAQLEADATPLCVIRYGKPMAALVKYEEYEALVQKAEDMEDALAMRQALERSEDEAMSLDEYQRRPSRRRRIKPTEVD